ncbi:MAG: FAD-binding oxidoreductase [Bacteroidetes bacterium]|nr:FAD-binding oxidoreductase [Bacteroidota bacterium]
MQRDVLIVGFGLAGWALTEVLKSQGVSFVVYDPLIKSSSRIATGIYNPVVLKRFRSIESANVIMEHAIPFYKQPKYKAAFHPLPIHRILTSVSEQNDWTVASDKADLSRYLNPTILNNTTSNVYAPFGVGIVEHSGWVDTNKLLTKAHQELQQQHAFVKETFNYDALEISTNTLRYKNWKINHVVFAEGVSVLKNPWFSNLPIVPNKGEWLIVSCKGFGLKNIVKSSVFVVPLGNDVYRVGATYAREFENTFPTEEAKTWLETQFGKLTDLPFEIIHHGTGFRPTVPDRRPIIGSHPEHTNIWCVNGLGSRGVLWAPYLATRLVGALNNAQAISSGLNLTRFW